MKYTEKEEKKMFKKTDVAVDFTSYMAIGKQQFEDIRLSSLCLSPPCVGHPSVVVISGCGIRMDSQTGAQ